MTIKHLLPMMLIASLVPIISGCDDDNDENDNDMIIWDFVPYSLHINIENPNGDNLLNPDIEGNIIGQTLTMTYEGETYVLDWDGDNLTYYRPEEEQPQSRYILPYFYGLVWTRTTAWTSEGEVPVGEYHIEFGELDQASTSDYRMTFRWVEADITRDILVRVVNNTKGSNADLKTTLFVDGIEQPDSDTPITIVKD